MNTLLCEKCNHPFVKKSGKFGLFYGCSNYPNCKNIINVKEYEKRLVASGKNESPILAKIEVAKNEVAKIKVWSDKQLSIYNAENCNNDNLIINAVAGSGKTTLLVELANRIIAKNPNASILYCTFATKNVEDISGKIDARVITKTLHSIGNNSVSAYYRSKRINAKVNKYKINNIFKNYLEFYQGDKKTLINNEAAIIKLVGLIKDTLLDCSLESIAYLSERYTILLNGDSDTILSAVKQIFNKSLELSAEIDFSDMLYPIAIGLIPVITQFDYILLDESQDNNACQNEVIKKILKESGKLIAVGDKYQSIYGFRAADDKSMDKIKEFFNCTSLPLSISYRCTKLAAQYVNSKYSELEFTVPSSAIEGEFLEIKGTTELIKMVKPDDLILCRNTSPLIRPCYELIKNGIKAIILGKDFSSQLVSLIGRVSNKYQCETIAGLMEALQDYGQKESEKLLKINQNQKLETLLDQIDTINELCEGINTVNDLYTKIDTIFSDYKSAVTLSTIHRAKGAEADNVYLINPELIGARASQEWEIEQEKHLDYVAHTRNKIKMVYVSIPKKEQN